MRAWIKIAGAGLVISGCGGNETANNSVSIDDNLAAENITANDTTAIDAATGDAANMAEDVDYSVNEVGNADENASDDSENGSGNAAD